MTQRTKFELHSQVREAKRAAKSGKSIIARALFTSLVSDFPDNKRAVEEAATGLVSVGALDDAIAVLEKAIAQMGESPVLLRKLATHLVRAQRWPAAADTLKRMAQVYPNDINVLLEWGRLAEAAGRIAEANEAFLRARAIDPNSPEAMLSLAGILMVEEKFDEAEQLLRDSIKQNPRFADARLKLSTLLLKSDRRMDALSAVDTAITLDRNAADGHCARGIVLREMEQYVLASLAFRRALTLDPRHREAKRQIRRLKRGNDPKSLPKVPPPAIPWTGNLITENPAFGQKIVYAQQLPGRSLKFGSSRKESVVRKAVALVQSVARSADGLTSVLDLNCGTGLFAAELVRKKAEIQRVVGVGDSVRELHTAVGKGVFGEIVQGDNLDVLDRIEGQFDLIVALDFFTRTREFEEPFQKIAGRLTPSGMIVYSVDLCSDGDWSHARRGRISHSLEYVHRVAMANNLTPVAGEEIDTRIEYYNNIGGYVGVLARV